MDEKMDRNERNDFMESYAEMSVKANAPTEAPSSEQYMSEPIISELIMVESIIDEPIMSESIIEETTMTESVMDSPVDTPVLTEAFSQEALCPEDQALYSNAGENVFEKAEAKKKPLLNNMSKKLAAACLVAVLGCGSMGIGLSVGQVLFERLMPETQTEEATSFAFSNYAIPVSQTASASSVGENIAEVFKNVSTSVVSINITGKSQKTFFNQIYTPQGAGSGLIFSEDEDNVYIVTNYHVIDEAEKVSISIDDEKQASARYVGGDSQADVAVVSVSKSDLKEADITDYKVADFGDSDSIQIGETVLAIGNALGEGKTMTRGIVSAIKKQTSLQDKTLDLIQTDAAINQGNSGGPLVDSQGLVVGINTAKLAGNGIEGMGYSIPSNTVKETATELLKNGTVDRPYLGVEVFSVTEDIQRMYDLPSLGVYIKGIVPGGSAAAAGLQVSDIIVGYGDIKVTTSEELVEAIAASKSGDVVKVYIYRNGKTPMMLEVTVKNMNEKF